MNAQALTRTLAEAFHTLADEVQNLVDRQYILEHKLRHAHVQFQRLADEYAAASPDVSKILVNLQVPPEICNSVANANSVPLPRRKFSDDIDNRESLAVIIREGRRIASCLVDCSENYTGQPSPGLTPMTSVSTFHEEDFTVQGKKGTLGCPYTYSHDNSHQGHQEMSEHEDPICAAMHDGQGSQPVATKCPIRYLDQHSPEEIANYLEKHKHELPRSHAICVMRYQNNEAHMRKLDAKFGTLTGMIEKISKMHQMMLLERDMRPRREIREIAEIGKTYESVEDWTHTVSATVAGHPDQTALVDEAKDGGRQCRFDRPMKEVRVGESPSRPWGISVPIYSDGQSSQGRPRRPVSPPPAPVLMPTFPPPVARTVESSFAQTESKCPFDHTKLDPGMHGSSDQKQEDTKAYTPITSTQQNFSPGHNNARSASTIPQPAFIYPTPTLPPQSQANPAAGAPAQPQMVFTGPVFIGYPIEQAIQLMQHYQASPQ
ncbi:hypothetical protein GGR50DRAFT_644308 [Xylaria sp. CBS 124048]|nr:hypothetical protein GGR50DRAFT_644308 [Xylaria sp. CBS 124048]